MVQIYWTQTWFD